VGGKAMAIIMELFSADNFIEETVNKYSDTIYRIALNITHSKQDSFDICQEVFIRLIQNISQIKSENHLKSWLIRVTINCSKTYMRKKIKLISLEDINELTYIQEYKDLTLANAVSRLPEKYSTVIYLHYYEDIKVNDIAKILKISPSAVKLRLKRGREKLKNILEKENYNA
jgi:RNA polymerase sigma-70 factor (ECF subfamily)